jgi:hypothetical protein
MLVESLQLTCSDTPITTVTGITTTTTTGTVASNAAAGGTFTTVCVCDIKHVYACTSVCYEFV